MGVNSVPLQLSSVLHVSWQKLMLVVFNHTCSLLFNNTTVETSKKLMSLIGCIVCLVVQLCCVV